MCVTRYSSANSPSAMSSINLTQVHAVPVQPPSALRWGGAVRRPPIVGLSDPAGRNGSSTARGIFSAASFGFAFICVYRHARISAHATPTLTDEANASYPKPHSGTRSSNCWRGDISGHRGHRGHRGHANRPCSRSRAPPASLIATARPSTLGASVPSGA